MAYNYNQKEEKSKTIETIIKDISCALFEKNHKDINGKLDLNAVVKQDDFFLSIGSIFFDQMVFDIKRGSTQVVTLDNFYFLRHFYVNSIVKKEMIKEVREFFNNLPMKNISKNPLITQYDLFLKGIDFLKLSSSGMEESSYYIKKLPKKSDFLDLIKKFENDASLFFEKHVKEKGQYEERLCVQNTKENFKKNMLLLSEAYGLKVKEELERAIFSNAVENYLNEQDNATK